MSKRQSSSEPWRSDLGACPIGPSMVRFRLWAPHARTVAVQVMEKDPAPIPMSQAGLGYFEVTASGVGAGARYRYLLDGVKARPDPASRFQPEGVHGPSAVVDPEAFRWTDQGWAGLPLEALILYELHVGTFTPEGTFQAVIPRLRYLRDELGVTAIELMPVAECPGRRNWGYDGAYPFAPQSSYGGPDGFKALVDACHAGGIAVILDVVYNHLGPEGNYLGDFGPYFTDRYRTPWGQAINYDGPDSDAVREYVRSNALYWVTEYHVDGLRLDAIHGIFDMSARHILYDLAEAVHAEAKRRGRSILIMAESDLNDVRVITPPAEGGYGLDAQWNDDFHHALHSRLTGERKGYYQDFGRIEDLAVALREGFVYSGQRSSFRRRGHGNSARSRPASQFIVCAQNHDQVGNRALGDRLGTLVPDEALRVAAAAVLLSPNIPLLFMGEEYGEAAPFLYFTDHGDPGLAEAVRRGRMTEFASFGWTGDIPDPQAPETFERSRVRPERRSDPRQATLFRWYRRLIALRKTVPALGASKSPVPSHQVWVHEDRQVLILHRWHRQGEAALLFLGFGKVPTSVRLDEPKGLWRLELDASAPEFGGTARQAAPTTVHIAESWTSIELPAYAVLLYLSSKVTRPKAARRPRASEAAPS